METAKVFSLNPMNKSEPNNSKQSQTPLEDLENKSLVYKNHATIKGEVVTQNMCCIK